MLDKNIEKIGSKDFGGKASNYLKLVDMLSKLNKDILAIPRTVVISASFFQDFVNVNDLKKVIQNAESGKADDHQKLTTAFMASKFTKEDINRLSGLLERSTTPMIVRSSSLLEDQKGFSFAGKYESVLIGNQGTNEARLEQLLTAIKKVFASTYNPNAIAYRRKHGFMKEPEAMGLLIQEVVGQKYLNYYLPAMAGVGFSQNGYCWNKEISKKDGLVRLVFGLGTRAVGRGYVRLFSPEKSSMRPEGTEVNNIQKCSQKKVDVIDLQQNELKSVHFRELIGDGFNCYPCAQAFVSLRDGNYLYRPVSNLWDSTHVPVLTMDGALSNPWMGLDIAKEIGSLLKELEVGFGCAVDIEFAINNGKIYLLQARPLSESKKGSIKEIPALKDSEIIFAASRNLPTAQVEGIEYLVYVDEVAYHNWPLPDRQSVARVIGKVNEALKGKVFALIGPGRWGSWNAELGVPVNYAEISNCAMLIEVARRKATYVPEVSFGSHFFQDLIEDNIVYLPLYPDEPKEIFNEKILAARSELSRLLSDDYYKKYDNLIKVIDLPGSFKKKGEAILNGELEKAVVFLK